MDVLENLFANGCVVNSVLPFMLNPSNQATSLHTHIEQRTLNVILIIEIAVRLVDGENSCMVIY